ncbi:SMC family ATPase [Streptomyces sp. SID13726]|uniref:AAA family ATPase n=1 Tax=Streptomyces sp. SID13726 TaxID=2706058 RepID=UPI0013BDCDD2|nr:SMC family ATPase [Streptomyces sp. SID13726]NEB04134.1 SMC family ATPase [Streptomyces sp. SID13726]
MRPLSITLSGVRSYTDTCGPLEFTDKNLVGILGDTGAGKSTLLEVILYALYGRTSWGAHGSQLIADGCEKMSVDFTFAVDGTPWRVTRIFHKKSSTAQVSLSTEGTTVNGATKVNARIEQLLNLDFGSFQSAVVLPQGKFDTLLNSSGTDRTKLLRSLLGIDELQRLRQRAADQRTRLDDLLLKAAEARGDLHKDPEGDAHRLGIRQAEIEKTAAGLSGHLDTLRQLRHQADGLQQHSTETARAAAALAERTTADVHAPLAVLVTDDRLLREQLEETERAQEEATRRRDRLQTTLDADRDTGLTVAALSAAAEVLESAPGLLNSLGEQQQDVRQDLDRLETDEQSVKQDEERLAEQAAGLDGLKESADKARAQSDGAEAALEQLTGVVRVLLEEGAAVAEHITGQAAARERQEELSAAETDAAAVAGQRRGLLEQASQAVEDLQRGDAAYTAGMGLAPGDACPVCTHTLDPAYTAPEPQDPKAMRQAKKAKTVASKASTEALAALQEIQADIRKAEQDEQAHREKAEAARARLADQLSPVQQQARSVAALTGHTAPESFAAHLLAAVNTAVEGLLAQKPPSAAERLALLDTLLPDARLRIEEAQRLAAAADETARSAAGEVQAEQSVTAERRKALEAGRTKVQRAQQRLDEARRQFLARLAALPRPVQVSVTDADALPSLEAIAACTSAVTAHLGRLGEVERDHAQALTDLQQLAEQKQDLAGEHLRRVAEPLHRQQTTLELRADAATTAMRLLQDNAASLPDTPGAWDNPHDVAAYATTLDTACSALREALDALLRGTQETINALASKATSAFQALAPLTPQAPALPAAATDLLFDPDAMTPFHQYEGALQAEAAQTAADRNEALSQIPHALKLQAAITAGKQERSAWAGLYEQLSDSLFPTHLTEQRTRSLFILGSRLLRDLSAGRFGFSDDFGIADLDNNTARSPRTLSGGETFQASLALSLALVELHSRTNARLESLFLDEGFATLDAGALDSALSVLRTHVGNDRLLAVISHLRPVAESVNDVLWVEKDVSGSTARWLTPQEHHALVRSDFHNLADLT